MPLPEASAAQASRPGASVPAQTEPQDDLICPAEQIIDLDALWSGLQIALDQTTSPRDDGPNRAPQDIRAIAVPHLQKAQKNGRDVIAAAFAQNPRGARKLVKAYAHLTDGLIRTIWRLVTIYSHPAPNPTASERLAVLAAGGYGRAEMAPQSDVDLLFLTPYKITPWAESVIESMLYILWDLRLKVGHSSRTIRDCLRLGRTDFTIRTALLELRVLDGDVDLGQELMARLWSDLFIGTSQEFIEAKLAEREERHKKQGGQRYVLEPNVKEGKGGLRDLQSLFWIAKYVHRVDRTGDLVAVGVFTADEHAAFEEAETFLWAVRSHLHLITGREMDQLTFDMQLDVADRMEYSDHGGRRAVEHFMQDYFRHATRVGELTRILLTAMEASHLKSEPMLAGLFRRRRKVNPPYDVRQNRLVVADEKAFLAEPKRLLSIFEEALRTGLLLHPNAMRLIAANLHLIDDDMRRNKDSAKVFLDLLLRHGNPERALRRMNELGVLSAFIPEFEPIVAMMQFNVYHHYTVDEHTIQCISVLAQIERGELVEELPIASRVLKEGVNRRIIYMALLLHDIGKGRSEDHSILGARMARSICPRLNLKKDETETVEWLVRYHLLMSDMAQKRDLSDPRTVRDFAKAVKTRKRLDLLTVLTVCDIRGVGPNTWNNWKAVLLRTLYHHTAEALEHGLEELNRENRGNAAKKSLRAALTDWSAADLRKETARHYPPYWQGLQTSTHVVIAELLHGLGDDEVKLDLTPDTDRDATRACFALADHPGIFTRVTGALALVGANVVDARSYTSKDGFATSVFWIQDGDGSPYEVGRLPRLRTMLHKILMGEVLARDALKSRDKVKKRESGFRFPTSVMFDNEGSDIYSIIEVDTRDRPGLLHDLSRTLAEANLYVASAVIATYGAQAVDTFYVKDMFGLKIHAKSKQTTLERKLREAILAGAERAKG
ncbi:[protein-PII] uridylyltransferase [Actibacterium sp. 188UL27-1]|nr:[protein-PII] uridylyltransferase [Actibacterium sp. 188UL27-1]